MTCKLFGLRVNLGIDMPILFATGNYPFAKKTDYDSTCTCGWASGSCSSRGEAWHQYNLHINPEI